MLQIYAHLTSEFKHQVIENFLFDFIWKYLGIFRGTFLYEVELKIDAGTRHLPKQVRSVK